MTTSKFDTAAPTPTTDPTINQPPLPPAAPKRRVRDTWAAWVPGLVIIGAAVGLHVMAWLGEHVTMAVVALGAKQLPSGRLLDAKLFRQAETARTAEQAAQHADAVEAGE